jgi:hypothetical protein
MILTIHVVQVLTRSGWRPTVSIESLLVSIRADIVAGGARLDMQRTQSAYTEAGALDAFQRVARQHGWE